MNQDLKVIKKYYGEKMMRLCRELFVTILDNSPGMLPMILLETLAPSHYVYDDIIMEYSGFGGNYVEQLKKYVFNVYDKLVGNERRKEVFVDDPVTLLKSVGYTLYECKTEKDIKKFEKYYQYDEKLCTFNSNRLKRCYVFFAVKDGADKLKRSDFINPQRQDEYGTSVISIQFTRDNSHTLSIKNRYNHTVMNPDATFSNDLDKIVLGLTQSFADYYGMVQLNYNDGIDSFEMLGYVQANDGRLYRYNYEIDNVYYCPGNIIIDDFKVYQYDKEKYIVMDYFILDLVNKKFINKLGNRYHDSFIIDDIKKIEIFNDSGNKKIILTQDFGEEVVIILDKYSQIISYKNNNIRKLGNDFLRFNETLEELELDSVEEIGDNFLSCNQSLRKISLKNLRKVGNKFLPVCTLDEISFLELEEIGNRFMEFVRSLKNINLPKVRVIGDCFLRGNNIITELNLKEVRQIGDNFLFENVCLSRIKLSKVVTIGNCFCYWNQGIKKINLPNVKIVGNDFMCCSEALKIVNMPKIRYLGKKMAVKSDFTFLNVLDNMVITSRKINLEDIDSKTVRKLIKKK